MLNVVPAFSRIGEENAFAVLARATELASRGRDIINLGIGQPDFPTPPHIVEAAIRALRDGHHGYTPATGILPLREAVAAGATLLKPGQKAFWGGYSGYFADPDGHLWEVAYNPFMPLDAEGRVQLPAPEA